MKEFVWRLIFLGLYLLFFLIRSFYSKEALPQQDPVAYQKNFQASIAREGKVAVTLRALLSNLLILSVILYVIYPGWLKLFSLDLPVWLRWTGSGLALACLPLLIWIHHTLGRQYSPNLELKEKHGLITSGPYRLVMHPMYTVLFAFMLGISLVSANLLVVLPHMLAVLLLCLRLGKEEAMLIDEFGEDYLNYRRNTGRLLPKFR